MSESESEIDYALRIVAEHGFNVTRPSASGAYAELVGRLKTLATWTNAPTTSLLEAVAVIAALEAEREKMRKELARALRSEKYLEQSARTYAKLAAEREGELDEAREALEPFREGNAYLNDSGSMIRFWEGDPAEILCRARSANKK